MPSAKNHKQLLSEALDIVEVANGVEDEEIKITPPTPAHIEAVFDEMWERESLYQEIINGLVDDLRCILDYTKISDSKAQARYGLKFAKSKARGLAKRQGDSFLLHELGLK